MTRKEYQKQYYINNKEIKKESNRLYLLKNREKKKESNRLYLLNNKEKVKEAIKKHRLLNKEYYKKYQIKYRLKNPSLPRFYCLKRKALKLKATPKFANLDKIKEIYKNCPKGYHVDHIVPLQGKEVCGLHVEWNLQYLTPSQNSSKSNKLINDYL